MTPRYRIRYLAQAVQELVEIHDLIAAYDGLASAGRKLDEIEAVTKGLADRPYVGSIRDSLPHGLRAIPAGKKAVVCFTIDEETKTVSIVVISYAGSDWMSRAKERL